MTRKRYTKIIIYCNQSCDHFWHNYEDGENCWCDRLNKSVADYGGEDVMNDYTAREIPKDCPLDDDAL